MDRRPASRAAARSLFACLDLAPSLEQLDIAQEHLESFARRQACGEWTVGGDSVLEAQIRQRVEEAVSQ